MAFPDIPGVTPGQLRRLATQAAYEIRRQGGRGPATRYWLEQRVPGMPARAYSWALQTAQRLVTATGRAENAGPKATMGSLFRGNAGLTPGYSVVVQVRVTLPGGQVRTGTYVVPNVVNSDGVSETRRKAEAMAVQTARQTRGQGRNPSCWRPIQATSIGAGSVESEIVSIIPTEGT